MGSRLSSLRRHRRQVEFINQQVVEYFGKTGKSSKTVAQRGGSPG